MLKDVLLYVAAGFSVVGNVAGTIALFRLSHQVAELRGELRGYKAGRADADGVDDGGE